MFNNQVNKKSETKDINNGFGCDECLLFSCDGFNCYKFNKKLLAKLSSNFNLIFKSTLADETASILVPNLYDDGLHALHQLIHKGQCILPANLVRRIKAQLHHFNIIVTVQEVAGPSNCTALDESIEPNQDDQVLNRGAKETPGIFSNKVFPSQSIEKFVILRLETNQTVSSATVQCKDNAESVKTNDPLQIDATSSNDISSLSNGQQVSRPSIAKVKLTNGLRIKHNYVSFSSLPPNTYLKIAHLNHSMAKSILKTRHLKMFPRSSNQIEPCSSSTNQERETVIRHAIMSKEENDDLTKRNDEPLMMVNEDVDKMTECIRSILPKAKYYKDSALGYVCFICCKTFRSPYPWRNHLMAQHFHDSYKCPECPARFKYLGTVRYHARSTHSPPIYIASKFSSPPLSSPKPKLSANPMHPDQLQIVIDTKKDDKTSTLPRKSLPRARRQSAPKLVVKKDQTKEPVVEEVLVMSEYINSIMPDGRLFKDGALGFICFVCDKSLGDHHSWKDHVMGQHFGRSFPCPECPKRYKYFKMVKRHLKMDHGHS